MTVPAGHSVRDRPGLIPNTEVKPHVAVILVRCVSPREVAVLALLLNYVHTKSICEISHCYYSGSLVLDVCIRVWKYWSTLHASLCVPICWFNFSFPILGAEDAGLHSPARSERQHGETK